MKTKLFILMALTAFGFIFVGCEKSEDDLNGNNQLKFLSLHLDGNEIGAASFLSEITVKDGIVEQKHIAEAYPNGSHHQWHPRTFLNNDIGVTSLHDNLCPPLPSGIGMHYSGIRRGLWFSMKDLTQDTLPNLYPGDGRYSFLVDASVKVSDNGLVFYFNGSHQYWYVDSYREVLVRYNPKNSETKTAVNPGPFVLGQPDVGSQYDFYKFKNGSVFPSGDGRYVYGAVQAIGVSGGALLWGPSILFKYDFNTETYTRIGDVADNNCTVHGITSDELHLYYMNGGDRKVINLENENVKTLSITGGTTSYAHQWNNSGFINASNLKKIFYYDVVGNSKKEINIPATAYDVMFNNDGSKILFRYSNNKNMLLTTSDLSENPIIDTLTTALPSNVRLLIKR